MPFFDEQCVAGNGNSYLYRKSSRSIYPAVFNVKLLKKEHIEVGNV